MDNRNMFAKILILIGIGLLQVTAAMLILLFVTLLFPALDVKPDIKPVLFILVTGICYAVGIFLVGWLSIHLKWRKVNHLYGLRAFLTLIGAFVPLLIALATDAKLEAGNPLFFVSLLTGILGFLVPELWVRKSSQ